MSILSAAYQWGLWMGLLAVVVIALAGCQRDAQAAEDGELALATVSGVLGALVALVFLALGGLPSAAMFIGSGLLGVVIGFVVVTICWQVMTYVNSRYWQRTAISRTTGSNE